MDIIDAILVNDIDSAKQLLSKSNVDLNNNYDDGITPLHYAAQNNVLEIIPLLINEGAKADRRTINGETPLDFARLHGNMHVIELLNTLAK